VNKIFKAAFLILLFFLLIFFLVASFNNNPEVIIKKVFKSGEFSSQVLKYRIYVFGIFPVGEANFYKAKVEKVNEKDLLHIKGTAKTSNMIAPFFKSEATLDSYIDLINFNPVLFKQKLVISDKPNQDKEIIYKQKQGFMILEGSKRQICSNTQDPLSLVFNLGRMDFDKNKEINMNINTKQKNYYFKGLVEKKQDKSKAINRNIYLVKSEIRRRDKNNPYHQSKVSIWFVKGDDNIPILINVFASGVIINVRLIGVE
jgi:hypothetical protein